MSDVDQEAVGCVPLSRNCPVIRQYGSNDFPHGVVVRALHEHGEDYRGECQSLVAASKTVWGIGSLSITTVKQIASLVKVLAV